MGDEAWYLPRDGPRASLRGHQRVRRVGKNPISFCGRTRFSSSLSGLEFLSFPIQCIPSSNDGEVSPNLSQGSIRPQHHHPRWHRCGGRHWFGRPFCLYVYDALHRLTKGFAQFGPDAGRRIVQTKKQRRLRPSCLLSCFCCGDPPFSDRHYHYVVLCMPAYFPVSSEFSAAAAAAA